MPPVKPKFDKPRGGAKEQGAPAPDLVPILLGTAGALGLAYMFIRWLRRIGLPGDDQTASLARWVANAIIGWLPAEAQQVLVTRMTTLSEQATLGLWLVAVVLFLLTVFVSGAPAYKRKFTFDTLIQAHAKRTPRVRPIVHCDPRDDKDPDGPWSPAPTHEHWAKRYGLVLDEPFPEERLEIVLLGQLKLINNAGPVRAGLCVRAVQSVCIARIVHGRAAGNRLIDTYATAFLPFKMRHYRKTNRGPYRRFFRPCNLPCQNAVEKAWAKTMRDGADLLAEARALHHYASTRCVWFLEKARAQSGVLEPSSLLWLRPVCRPLWSAIHQVGLNCANIEACAIAAHYAAENHAEQALNEPHFEAVLWGLRQTLWPDESTVV